MRSRRCRVSPAYPHRSNRWTPAIRTASFPKARSATTRRRRHRREPAVATGRARAEGGHARIAVLHTPPADRWLPEHATWNHSRRSHQGPMTRGGSAWTARVIIECGGLESRGSTDDTARVTRPPQAAMPTSRPASTAATARLRRPISAPRIDHVDHFVDGRVVVLRRHVQIGVHGSGHLQLGKLRGDGRLDGHVA